MIYITVVSRLRYAVPCGPFEGVGPSTQPYSNLGRAVVLLVDHRHEVENLPHIRLCCCPNGVWAQ